MRDPLNSIFSLDDPAVLFLLKEVPRASQLLHSDRSFLEHLIGTWWILNKWNLPRAICRAGLMHSCYSTLFYPHALFKIQARPRVREIIGPQAEALAYRFCVLDRAELWSLAAQKSSLRGGIRVTRTDNGRRMFLAEGTVKSLLLIESANLAEQSAAPDGQPLPWMWRVVSWSRLLGRKTLPLPFHLLPTLTLAAEQKAVEAYRRVLNAPLSAVGALLDETIRLNPWAAEPRLLRALHSLERRDKESAIADTLRSHALLSAWAVTWDKRWTLRTWLNLNAATMQAVIKRDHASDAGISFKSVKEALAASRVRR